MDNGLVPTWRQVIILTNDDYLLTHICFTWHQQQQLHHNTLFLWRQINSASLLPEGRYNHYTDVIMSAMACQITGISLAYWTVYSDENQRKRQSSASLALLRGIHRWPVNSQHKRPVTLKMFPLDDVITNDFLYYWLFIILQGWCPKCRKFPFVFTSCWVDLSWSNCTSNDAGKSSTICLDNDLSSSHYPVIIMNRQLSIMHFLSIIKFWYPQCWAM